MAKMVPCNNMEEALAACAAGVLHAFLPESRRWVTGGISEGTVRRLYGGKSYPPSSWAVAVEDDTEE